MGTYFKHVNDHFVILLQHRVTQKNGRSILIRQRNLHVLFMHLQSANIAAEVVVRALGR